MNNTNKTPTHTVESVVQEHTILTEVMTDNTPTTQPISHFNRQLDAFYQQLYKELNFYLSDAPTNANGEQYRNFLEYWTYTLFRDYGIKRKIHKYGETAEEDFECDLEKQIFGDNKKLLVQFYYDKANRAYDKTNLITQLCRHMLFDFASFSIVSLGVTKSLDLKTMVDELPSINEQGHKQLLVERFSEGTMMVFNPALQHFNYEIMQRDVDEEAEQSERQIRHFETSTRRKIGTSYFNNPGMTFQQMFDDNNKIAGFDWEKIPNDFKNKYCFVFNVEHRENRIVSPIIQNMNTLVAVYELKPIDLNTQLLTKLIRNGEITTEAEFFRLRENILVEVPPFMINHNLQTTFNQQLNIPQVITPFQGTYEDLQMLTSNIINQQGKYDVGLIVKDMYSGARSKVRNPNYSELLEIKGHVPISLNENNNSSLFRLWWRLKNDKQIKKFLSVFETPEGEYERLFRSYYDKLVNMTQQLFNVYQAVFVRKEMPAKEIEYKFKPMCGDLHKAYMAEKRGRIKKDVVEYVNSRDWYQIYWRLFGLSEDIEAEINELTESTEEIKLPDTE